MTTYAGLYGPEALIDGSGHPITSATIDVFTHGTTTHVSLYQDNARVTPLSNPVPNGVDGSTAGRGLDTFGNLSFYIDPGRYDLRIATGAGTRTVEIEVETDPAESAASVVAGIFASRPAAGTAGKLYIATDVGPAPGTMYEDSGSAWAPLAGLTELGYAEKNDANFSTTSAYPTAVAVTGLSLSFTAGDRPFYVYLECLAHNTAAAAQAAVVAIQESTDAGSTWTTINYASVNTTTPSSVLIVRRRSLTRGTAVQYRAGLCSFSSGTSTIDVDATSSFPNFARLYALQV